MKRQAIILCIVLVLAVASAAADADTFTIRYVLPPWCGDGVAEGAEQCDDSDFNGQSCTDFGFDTGSLACTAGCTINTAGCSTDEGGGGGGGGGGPPAPPGNSSTITVSIITDDEPKTLSFFNPNIAFTKLTILVDTMAENVQVTISKIDRDDAPDPLIRQRSYQYLELETTNLADQDIDEINILFTVTKAWLEDSETHEDDISLYRYEGEDWAEYPAELYNETNETAKYNVTVGGFSYFAIGQRGLTAYVEEFVEEPEPEPDEEPAEEPEEDLTGQVLDTPPPVVHKRVAPSVTESLLQSLGSLILTVSLILIIVMGIIYYIFYYGKHPKFMRGFRIVNEHLKQRDSADISLYQNTKEVKQYILQALRKGKSRQKIVDGLIRVGWDELIIDKVFDEVEDDILQGRL